MSDCTHDCPPAARAAGAHRAPGLPRPANGPSHIGKVIAVVTGGKGGGRAWSPPAVAMRRMGKTVGVLDADITGLHPTAFVHTKAEGSELGIYPAEHWHQTGIETFSTCSPRTRPTRQWVAAR